MSIRPHTFFYYLLFLAALLIQPVRSQGILGIASGGMANNPIVSGELGGMQVAVQGAFIAFMAAKAWHGTTFDLDACARDLHCTMQKNNTDAVVVSPEGVWIVHKPGSSINTGSIVPTEPLLPSVFQSGRAQLKPGNTPSITFIATEEIQPTATLATMNTGIEVIEKTPAIVWLNSSTMQWLAEELVEWFGIWRSNNTLDEDESQRQTRIIDEYHGHSSRLTSSSSVPSPQITSIENRFWEDGLVRLETKTDILTIWPSASSQYQTSGSYNVTMRQVPSGSDSSNTETQTVPASPTPTDEHLPAQPPQGLLEKRSASTVNNVLENETGQPLALTKSTKLIRPEVTAQSPLAKLTSTPLQPSKIAEKTSENEILPIKYEPLQGKHIAKRSIANWPNYGDPKTWDIKFEEAVKEAVYLIKAKKLTTIDLLGHFEKKRNEIAVERKNKKSVLFGLRRDDIAQRYKADYARAYFTPMHLSSPYGYALDRAFMLSFDGKHYIEKQSSAGAFWSNWFYPYPEVLEFGLVQGKIKGEDIPLTQYVFSPRIKKFEIEKAFGFENESYKSTPNGLKSAIWVHPDRDIIPKCIEHINELVKMAMHGDLTVIPKIHWWYVHLAPTWRGSGGIAEMLTNTLCRIHGVDLPPWKEGVAPSVEVLLEPNEEKFCSNYHQLFDENQKDLKILFKGNYSTNH